MRPLSHRINNLLKYREAFHHYVYVISLSLLGACLPLSIFGISFSIIVLISNWVLEADFKYKFNQLLKRKSVLLVLSILLLYFIGLIYTDDIHYGMKRIKVLLILMTVNLVLGTMKPLSKKELKFIFQVFIAAVLVASVISIGNYYGWYNTSISDIRKMSKFIFHIHFSLIINFSVIILLYLLFYNYFEKTIVEATFYIISVLWLTFFVFFFRSFSGVILFSIVLPIFTTIQILRVKKPILKNLLLLATVIFILSALGFIIWSILSFYNIKSEEIENLEPRTVNGNLYLHDLASKQIENGHYVWIYVCEDELRQEWNKISSIPYDSLDQKGQLIKYTLIRYLTSKGLRKDSAGLNHLKPEDIRLIEEGYSNYIFKNKYGIYPRVYQTIWEIDIYLKSGEVYSHSFTQRIAFLKLALKQLKENLFFGVGTGDLKMSMKYQREQEGIMFQQNWVGKPHNQYINFLLTFGITGFVWIFFSLITPVFIERKRHVILLKYFFLIYFISMFYEDTFDAHVGIAFFAFFYCIFIYLWDKDAEAQVSGKI